MTDAQHNYQTRRRDDRVIDVIATKMDAMHSDMNDMKQAVRGLTDAVTKLALIEERQTQAALAQERAFKVIERLENKIADCERELGSKLDGVEGRVDTLERDAPMQRQTSVWVTSAVWAAAGFACLIVLNKLGLLG